MRWVRDLTAIFGMAAILAGAAYVHRQRQDRDAQIQRAIAEVRRLELEVKYRAATGTGELTSRGWPRTVDAEWFRDGRPPVNGLLDEDRPWLEIAGTDQAELRHPPIRIAVDETLAGLWYNPYQGVVRARVPVMVNDEKATALYNRVNDCAIPSIFWTETPAPSLTASNSQHKTGPVSVERDEEKPVPTVVVRRTTPRP